MTPFLKALLAIVTGGIYLAAKARRQTAIDKAEREQGKLVKLREKLKRKIKEREDSV